MKAVYKFELQEKGVHNGHSLLLANMQQNAVVVHIGFQGQRMFVWAVVETESEIYQHNFLRLATGQEIPVSCAYVHTYQEGPYVWHLFELL